MDRHLERLELKLFMQPTSISIWLGPRQFSGPKKFRIVVPGLVYLDCDNATVHTATSVRKLADFLYIASWDYRWCWQASRCPKMSWNGVIRTFTKDDFADAFRQVMWAFRQVRSDQQWLSCEKLKTKQRHNSNCLLSHYVHVYGSTAVHMPCTLKVCFMP